MKELTLNRVALSRAIWHRIFENAEMLSAYKAEILSQSQELEKMRSQAAYDTGSISAAAVWTLTATAYYFAPKVIAEVGTFIGRSTYAIAEGCYYAGVNPTIHTCDFSNDIDLTGLRHFAMSNTELIQYRKKSSLEMFMALEASKASVDWVHLDGRLTDQEMQSVKAVQHDRTLYTMDDFEGLEKGVANTQRLINTLGTAAHLLIYPPERDTLEHFGLRDGCTTAMLLPRCLFALTAQ